MTSDKYDGIRAQLVRRGAQNYPWSRGEALITERFPELAALRRPEGTVIDGELRAPPQHGVGRTRDAGTWRKWKIDPCTIDAVLTYAQVGYGHGRRASRYTDYTFARWDADVDDARTLVPFTQACSGLRDAEIALVDHAVRKTPALTCSSSVLPA